MNPQQIIAATLKTVPETGTYESDAQAILDALADKGFKIYTDTRIDPPGYPD